MIKFIELFNNISGQLVLFLITLSMILGNTTSLFTQWFLCISSALIVILNLGRYIISQNKNNKNNK